MVSIISEHLKITPGLCGGKPHIAGHRIKVQDIVISYKDMGLSPAEIIDRYPTWTLANVHAALAYYYDHEAEIQQQILEDEALIQEMKAQTPSLVASKS